MKISIYMYVYMYVYAHLHDQNPLSLTPAYLSAMCNI